MPNTPPHYRLILFDCVNTLYLPDPARLPMIELDGRRIPSTASLLHEELARLRPGITAGEVHHAARAAWRWAESQRGPRLEEVPAVRRFRHFLGLLELNGFPESLVEDLLEVHMHAVTGSFDLPPEHLELLARLRETHRMALFSNFDHAPSLLKMLRNSGIDSWFDPLIISEGLGFRKPGEEAFSLALDRTGEDRESILFVGDSLEDDVAGARRAGLDIAWINRGGGEAPQDCQPTYELQNLPELVRLLEP